MSSKETVRIKIVRKDIKGIETVLIKQIQIRIFATIMDIKLHKDRINIVYFYSMPKPINNKRVLILRPRIEIFYYNSDKIYEQFLKSLISLVNHFTGSDNSYKNLRFDTEVSNTYDITKTSSMYLDEVFRLIDKTINLTQSGFLRDYAKVKEDLK